MDDLPFLGYPTTQHLEDSQRQENDRKPGAKFSALSSGTVVYEEKVDGANSGFGFTRGGLPFLQSRGHYLNLGSRSEYLERHFNPLKEWLLAHSHTLQGRFGDRFIVYGEAMCVVHTVFYDRLPHYFLEFDIWDRAIDDFLDTDTRRALCDGMPFVSVPVLYRGEAQSLSHLKSLVRPSAFRTPGDGWRDGLHRACALLKDDFNRRLAKVEDTDRAEGCYVKLERQGRVAGRFKWVRPGFRQTISDAGDHWQSRFPVPNLLAGVSDMFPSYLALDKETAPSAYNPDVPWEYAPWILSPGETSPGSMPLSASRRR